MQEIMENIIISDIYGSQNMIQWLKEMHDMATVCVILVGLIFLCVAFIAFLTYIRERDDN